MSGKLVGDRAMTAVERQRRHRAMMRAMRDVAPPPDVVAVQAIGNGPEAIYAPPAGKPRPADYPRMLYHPDGRTTVVDTPEHHDQMKPEGWGTAPLAVHRQRPVSHHGFLGTDNFFVLPMRRW